MLKCELMFDEPEETPAENASDPKQRANEKAAELRMHAEMAAVFEGVRKYDAQLLDDLKPTVARDLQKRIALLEKKRLEETALLPADTDAPAVLNFSKTSGLTTNDYHVLRKPGELIVARWLVGDQVNTYYNRLQAHFDAAFNQYREDERQSHSWKQNADIDEQQAALDAINIKMADRYLREPIREHKLFVLSTQTADELNISYLADYLMSVPIEELVGEDNAPTDLAGDADRTWFFKLFSLRGIRDDVEQMMFFAFLQKADESW